MSSENQNTLNVILQGALGLTLVEVIHHAPVSLLQISLTDPQTLQAIGEVVKIMFQGFIAYVTYKSIQKKK